MCCGLTAPHNCAHHHPHGWPRLGCDHISPVTQSRHSPATPCPAGTTQTQACSRCSVRPGGTVRAHTPTPTTATRGSPGPGNSPLLSSPHSLYQVHRTIQTVLSTLQLSAGLQNRSVGREQETFVPGPSQHGRPEQETTLRGGGQQEALGRSYPHRRKHFTAVRHLIEIFLSIKANLVELVTCHAVTMCFRYGLIHYWRESLCGRGQARPYSVHR